jgi:TetR/AcrR family transcriptional repressor of nem operon
MSRTRTVNDDIILDRALNVFWRCGYAGTSMRDLSKATGLGAAALYHRFSDKDGLFVETVRRYADDGLNERLTRLSGLPDPVAAIRGFLDEMIEMSVTDPDQRGCLLVNTALDGAPMSGAARDLVRSRLRDIENFFRGQLRRMVAADPTARDIDPDRMAETLFATVLAIRVLARLDADPDRFRRLAETALAPLTQTNKVRTR